LGYGGGKIPVGFGVRNVPLKKMDNKEIRRKL